MIGRPHSTAWLRGHAASTATLRRCASQRPESERRSQRPVDAHAAIRLAPATDGCPCARTRPQCAALGASRLAGVRSHATHPWGLALGRNAAASCLHCDPSPDVNVRAFAPVVLTLPRDGPPSHLRNTDALNRSGSLSVATLRLHAFTATPARTSMSGRSHESCSPCLETAFSGISGARTRRGSRDVSLPTPSVRPCARPST